MYRSIFNPTLSGLKLINTVLQFRTIDKILGQALQSIDKTLNSRKYLIVTHGNRYFASVLLNQVPGLKNATELLTPDENDLSLKLQDLIQKVEAYIEENYQNAYPARFFANPSKIQELYDNI